MSLLYDFNFSDVEICGLSVFYCKLNVFGFLKVALTRSFLKTPSWALNNCCYCVFSLCAEDYTQRAEFILSIHPSQMK